MNAIANVVMGAIPDALTTGYFRTVVSFCSVILLAFFCMESYGLDLSPGFF